MMLSGLHVVELAGPFSQTCVRILAALGARVTRADALPALTDVDVLVASESVPVLQARRLSLASLRETHPGLITATISPFGSEGPHAHYRGAELVCAAMSGVLRLSGDADRPPVKEALDACVFHASAAAAAGIMLAYWERTRSGQGQHVDIAIQEVATSRLTNALLLWQFDRRKLERASDQLRYGRASVRCLWQLQDGYAFHTLMSGRMGAEANQALVAWMDELQMDHPLRDVDWLAYDRSALTAETRAQWESALAGFFRARTQQEIAIEGRRRGINAAVVQEPAAVLSDPQLAARGFFRTEQRAGRSVQVPHEFLHVQLAAAPAREASKRATLTPPSAAGALSHVKVLDLSWALVGSLTTKALADHGACVIKVESAQRPCLTRVDVQVSHSTRGNLDDKPWYAHLNTSKLSLQLDLKHPDARTLLDPLIAWADVIVENFSPGTLDKLGLGYHALHQRRPDLIMISASAYGQTGPLAHSWGVDGTSAALSSRTFLTGWPDRGPSLPGAVPYADAVVPQVLIATLLAALVAREQTGRGSYCDVSMYELSVLQMERALLAAQLGPTPARSGNLDTSVWHQGVYPTRGVERWIAITLDSRIDYSCLTALTGVHLPDLDESRAPEQLAAFDQALSEFTREQDDYALMHQLQMAGIAAGVVQDVEDLLDRDPTLRARPAWAKLDHAALGPFEHQTTPHHLMRTPSQPGPAPRLGQHNRWVCKDLLQLDDEAYAQLERSSVFR